MVPSCPMIHELTFLQISTCVGFQAIAKATTKFSKGLRYTGVGSVICARSEMFLANGVGNLQKGERCVSCVLCLSDVSWSY